MRASPGRDLDSALPCAACPASRGDCDCGCATERAAARRRDLTGLRRTYGIGGDTVHKGVQRFLSGGYPSRLAGCWGV